MSKKLFERLLFTGCAPRTLLDVGAHVGTFSKMVREVLPTCIPTLIEPNPFCHEDLAKLPFESFGVAASSKNGRGQLFLTKEWLQSTGASLFRENTAAFRDEVVVEHPVETVRLDDLLKGRRFDFVKIDTQGAELEVILGAPHIISRAEHVLIEMSLTEYNKGGAWPEAVYAAMRELGFQVAEIAEFHRPNGGALVQLDLLFERAVKRPRQSFRYSPLNDHAPVLEYLGHMRHRNPEFSVIDVGAAANSWSAPVLDATLDLNDCAAAPLHFRGNVNDVRSWDRVLEHVSRHGRFSFCICSHTLEDIAYPAVALEMMPRIADAGYVAVPSRYLESIRPEAPYRGYIHHRWVFDAVDDKLTLAPKIPLLDFLTFAHEADWAKAPERFQFQLFWRGGIEFSVLNGDYLGPNKDAVVEMYTNFFGRP
jgi:FkbM family methyltransferase